ncbi:C-C motif chemokine 3-like [Antechinus flavipes]|uniref:C-C motif chemokine 3-like n=1 Tax=Antechinus flavipes TaxID=38775 RepID=UPI0022362F08|nr:C-C motif chemokine 3-like [Antechinus flavipes]
MKVSVAALSILIVMAFSSLASSAPWSVITSPLCCYDYNKRIPRHRVQSYVETGSQCYKPAVVFTTNNGTLVCANPRDAWVQDYINYVNSRSNSTGK